MHISNRFIDLRPVVGRLARVRGKRAKRDSVRHRQLGAEPSDWVLMTDNLDFLASPALLAAAAPGDLAQLDGPLWTDDFSSVAPLLTWE